MRMSSNLPRTAHTIPLPRCDRKLARVSFFIFPPPPSHFLLPAQRLLFFFRSSSTTSFRCNTLKIGPASEAPDLRFKLRIRPRTGRSNEGGRTPLPQTRLAVVEQGKARQASPVLPSPHHTSLSYPRGQRSGTRTCRRPCAWEHNHQDPKFSGRVVKCRPAAGYARSKAFEHLWTAPIPRQRHCGGDVCCREASD